MPEQGILMTTAAILILLGVLASKVSDRLGVPALLLFLFIGTVAGSEGIGGIEFDDHEAAQAVGVVALAFILFSGGLDTNWHHVRPVLGRAAALATAGVLGTAVIVGVAASWMFGVPLVAGLLLGSIVSSTDAAAVFSVLRSRSVRLKGELRPLLELESGSNDPMAVFLTLAFIEIYQHPEISILEFVPLFLVQMLAGAAVGYGAALAGVALINRLRLVYEGLYPVLLLAVVLLVYGLTALLNGSGFLAVYVAGITMGNARLVHKRSLMRFADGLAWLMQIAMFLVLGLLVFPSQLWPVAGRSLLVAAVLILVARPFATIVTLSFTRFPLRESLLVSWVGLRGAVPIVLATFPLVAGVPRGDVIFNITFFVVLTSVLVQGTTIPLVARWLGVAGPALPETTEPREYVKSAGGTTDLHEIRVPEESAVVGQRLVDLELPENTLVVLIIRDNESLVPQGSTVVQSDDVVLLVADEVSIPQIRAMMSEEDNIGKQ